MSGAVELSVVVPVTERSDDADALYGDYKRGVEATGRSFEFVYVLDGHHPDVLAALQALRARGEPIRILTLARWFGEATALTIGFAHARGEVILTLPAYRQVEPGEIPRVVAALDGEDMVIARRYPRRDTGLNVLQSKVFHSLLRRLAGTGFHDLGCGVRALRRRVAEEVTLYGDQHRFLPLLAERHGFRVCELDVAQAAEDTGRRIYPLGVYVRRLLDILTIVFIVKFTRKPLRFFGLIGSATLFLGLAGILYLVFERLVLHIALADRPALVLAVLMIVLGFQMIAVGLIGELIIFTRAKDVKDYTIDRIIE